jgi:GT2 family glycosyltransferase
VPLPPATVVVCTHDRAHTLARAVRGALAAAAPLGAEVLVVDNASTDETPAVLASLSAEAPGLRVAGERELGLSVARNRGLAEARGAVTVFLDDDAEPHPGWLPALLAPYADAGVACVGGPIRVRFAAPAPAWLDAPFHPALSAYDAGPVACRLHHRDGKWFPTGANISFRTVTARAAGGFSRRLGPLGRRPVLHDETDLCFRLHAAGWAICYAPDAAIDHWIFPERLTPSWFVVRHREAGRSAALCALRNRGVVRAAGALRWYLPMLAAGRYTPCEPVDGRRLLAECRRQEALGYLGGLAEGVADLGALRRDAIPAPSAPAASGHDVGVDADEGARC